MRILLPTLAVAFVAFSVWLGVRIYNRREKWAKRTAVGIMIGMPLLYVLSFGPACWYARPEPGVHYRLPPSIYWPIGWVCTKAPRSIVRLIGWYAIIGNDRQLMVPTNPSGTAWVGFSG